MKTGKIHVIITGGTLDSYYDGAKDTVVPAKQSGLQNFFEIAGIAGRIIFTQICLKDSRQLNKADIKKVLKAIEKSPCKKFIVTHGTYTMPDTSRFLKANLKSKNKTVILTGSMIPLSGFSPSDAPFNLGYAISKLEVLQPGIYICMNAKTFTPEEVAKNMAKGKFYSIFGEK